MLKLRSVKTKVIGSILGIIIFFGAFASVATYFISKNIMSEVTKDDALVATTIQAHETKQVFNHSQDLVKTIATQHNVVGMLEDPTGDDLDHVINHGLLYDFNIADMYSAIYLMDKDGLTVASTDERFIGKNYSFRDYFKEAVSGESFTDVAVGVTSGKLGYYFSHPILSSDGQIIGVAVAKLKPEAIHETISDQVLDNRKIMLVDSYGVVIFSNDEKKLFCSLGQLPESVLSEITENKRYANEEIRALDYSEVLDELDSLDGSKTFEVSDKIDNEEELLSVARIGDLDFYIVGEMDLEIVESFATKSAHTITAFVVFAAIFAGVIISLLITRLSRPLSDLTQAAEDISAGNLKTRVEIRSEDEIGKLAEAFNEMINQLVSSREHVEEQVKERTEELEKLNQSMVGRELKMVELKKEIKKKNEN